MVVKSYDSGTSEPSGIGRSVRGGYGEEVPPTFLSTKLLSPKIDDHFLVDWTLVVADVST